MASRSIRISNEADLILDNLKLKARQRYHKTIYKRDILEWFINYCLTMKQAENKFWNYLKNK